MYDFLHADNSNYLYIFTCFHDTAVKKTHDTEFDLPISKFMVSNSKQLET